MRRGKGNEARTLNSVVEACGSFAFARRGCVASNWRLPDPGIKLHRCIKLFRA